MPERIEVKVRHFPDRTTLQLQWADPVSGKRKTKSSGTADEAEAEQARADLEYELNNGIYAEPTKASWEAFREVFETEFLPGRRANTQRNYLRTLDLFEQLAMPRHMAGITERTISAFVASLRGSPGRRKGSDGTSLMMPSTIKVRLQFLHTVLTWAAEQGFLAKVPSFPPVKVPHKDPQPVPAELFERLTAVNRDPQMNVYLLCGWLAGLRLSEAFELCWEECTTAPYLDFARRRIILPAEFVKADRDQWLPLDVELQAALEEMPRTGVKVFDFRDRRGVPLLAGGVSQRIVRLAKKAKVRLTMKALRRGFGCRHAAKVSAHVLQRLLRHANIQTSLAFYASYDDAVEEAILGPQGNRSGNNSGNTGQESSESDPPTPSTTPCHTSTTTSSDH